MMHERFVAGRIVVDIHKPLSILAHVAVFAGIVYTIAQTVLFFAFGPEGDAPTAQRGSARAASAAPEDIPVESIVALHLFGRPSLTSSEQPAVAEETLRDTRLSLELVGVFVADPAAESMAVIARKGQPPERFLIGENVLGDTKLAAVHPDRVVLSRGSRRENLRFDQSSSFVQPGSQMDEPLVAAGLASSSASPAPDAPAAGQREVAEYRDENAANSRREWLERLERELAASDEGNEEGYTLGALADRPELSHTGLLRSDRILSVNGKSVSDLQGDRLEIDNILALGSASFEVQRGERRFVVTLSLN